MITSKQHCTKNHADRHARRLTRATKRRFTTRRRLIARAIDNLGGATQTSITIIADAAYNQMPTATLIKPVNNTNVAPQSNVALQASAVDTDGTVTQVQFYANATLIATAPYSAQNYPYYYATWNNVPAGSYTITAKSTDNLGGTKTSSAATLNVDAAYNQLPTVTLTKPANNLTLAAPASLQLQASSYDTDGSVQKVEFYANGNLVASVPNNPQTYPYYTTTWSSVPAGSYSITAKATDNLGGTKTTAANLATVTGAGPKLYYVYSDQLNTPREITDQTNKVVWRWDNLEPFGNTVANDDPDGDGIRFTYNQRFPGQYFDRETNLHYNYFRDCYDPATGRYCQSDPVGLRGGLNGYQYALSNPLSFIDPDGLDVTVSFNGGAARGAGHVGLGVNSPNTVGQRPQPRQSQLAILVGENVPGQISPDPAPDARVVIPTTPRQDQQVQQCIDTRTQEQQNYNLYRNNCAQFVGQCLRAAGVPVPDTRYPRTLYRDIERRFGGDE